MIRADNVDNVKAQVVVEVANGPTTSKADHVLADKGILVVPDILANAGGVTVSYFEWVQNKNGFYWSLDEVHQKLHETMVREFNHIYDIMQEKNISMRTAAYVHGLNRLSDAMSAQGTHSYFSENA